MNGQMKVKRTSKVLLTLGGCAMTEPETQDVDCQTLGPDWWLGA